MDTLYSRRAPLLMTEADIHRADALRRPYRFTWGDKGIERPRGSVEEYLSIIWFTTFRVNSPSGQKKRRKPTKNINYPLLDLSYLLSKWRHWDPLPAMICFVLTLCKLNFTINMNYCTWLTVTKHPCLLSFERNLDPLTETVIFWDICSIILIKVFIIN